MKKFEHGGNIHKFTRDSRPGTHFIDFSANINPIGPPEWLRPLVSSHLQDLIHYPDPENSDFVEAITRYTAIPRQQIIAANGTTELLYALTRLLPCKRAVIPTPSYVDYIRAAELGDMVVTTVPLVEETDFSLNINLLSSSLQPGDLAIIATPNNPTGKIVKRMELLSLIESKPDVTFLIDEAFLDFVNEADSFAGLFPNIATLNSMTKFYGLPGLRIGFGTFPPRLAELLKDNIPPWTVNTLAQLVGVKALEDKEYQEKTRSQCKILRGEMFEALQNFSRLKVFSSCANYLLLKAECGEVVDSLVSFCLARNILIRKCENYHGLSKEFFRIAVKNRAENEQLIAVLHKFFKTKQLKNRNKAPCRSLMLQGTCSDAGKSILSAALCRIFRQDGFHVAPFKSQNMSLNSFVTLQGDEMGRAQVVQAQAAKVDPDCRMNPVLLKPNSDTGSQIIVTGQPVGNMSVLEYNSYKPRIWKSVCSCYDSLAAEYDIIVLEGAGSPGEVNLKRDDIVNMKMARYAGSPVLIVGDIDRGGVYASFVGIMEVLAHWERELVSGFIVNKFRGHSSLLESAHGYVKMHTGREVVGVIPYLSNLGLPEEDSVSFKKGSFNSRRVTKEGVEICVISTPHISNFTDVEPFLSEPDVTLHIIEKASDLGTPQAVIIPGSKNVIHDLTYLKESGFYGAINRCREAGSEIVGICGGYQILGKTIDDPFNIESSSDQIIDGFGYLEIETVIARDKRLIRKKGVHSFSDKEVFGYEIHHGVSTTDSRPLIRFNDGSSCGSIDESGCIWGSYLHGIFDSDEFRRWFIDRLREKKGLKAEGKILFSYDLEDAFERLAASFRENVDMEKIYSLMGV